MAADAAAAHAAEIEQRTAALEQIRSEILALEQSPLYAFRAQHGYHPVIGEGSPVAPIMFIGEAPGEREAKTGRPFVGQAGRVLNELLASIGLERGDIYITNVVKDRPPENRDPTPAEIALYTPFLERQIALIQPKVIVTLGRFAMDFILGKFAMPERGQKISQLHGQVLAAQGPSGEIAVVPLFHPASALYTDKIDTLRADIQVLKQFL
jgi:DNA polymerase